MKKILLTLTVIFISLQVFTQTVNTKNDITEIKSSNASTYRLFPTQNMWNFIKLNTKNGQMWQVQFDVKGDNRGVCNLNTAPLVTKDQELIGRFTLHPTQNMFTFILLDQIDGRTWQVQWSMEINNRGIIPIE